MSVKSLGGGQGGGGSGGNANASPPPPNNNTSTAGPAAAPSTSLKGEVVRSGMHKKLKTSRRKYFVLRAETADTSARLEYYDTEKKFASGQPPKRSIPLKTCFNINRRNDVKHKNVIALYTKDDCFSMVFDSEEELDSWLKALLSLQHGGDELVDGQTPKPTFEHVWLVHVLNRGLGTSGIIGNYRLCLTDKTLSLIRVESNKALIELNLANIRSCGSLKHFFFLEIGRSSTLGAGELWMDTKDENIAQNIHSTIFHAMTTNGATGVHGKDDLGPKGRNRSSSATESSKPNTAAYRNKTNSTSSTTMSITSSATYKQPHTMQGGKRTATPGGGWPSTLVSHQRTQSLPLAHHGLLTDLGPGGAPNNNNNTTNNNKRLQPPTQSKCVPPVGGSGGRDRCDSMPSRARTASESNYLNPLARYHVGAFMNHHRFLGYGRDISHSPPSSSPVSPPSVSCSTDSTGSSYSIADEPDCCSDIDNSTLRYSLPMTPDEPIQEEDCHDYGSYSSYVPMRGGVIEGYVDMTPRGRHNTLSPTASLSSVTSGTPSTDLKFSDYPPDKVGVYFTSEDSDDSRPIRAYSVGSRPEAYRKVVAGSSLSENRMRASSVGSKNKQGPNRIFTPHSHNNNNKSSSAPILSNSSRSYSNSHGSLGTAMGHLMEMDFSRSNSSSGGENVDKFNMHLRSTAKNANSSGYVEMKAGDIRVPNNDVISPYVDMSSGSSPAKSHTDETFVDLMALGRYREPNYMDMSRGSPKQSSSVLSTTPEGYVEMTVGGGRPHHHQRQSSADWALSQMVGGGATQDDYATMNFAKPEPKTSNNKKRSQPITITTQSGGAANKHTTSSPFQSLIGTLKHFGGGGTSTTPPNPLHLPLSSSTTYSSLPRQRKNSRRDSRDSSSSSVTTPSSSSTMFPMSLNSPCSPSKSSEHLSSSDSLNMPSGALKIPASILNTVYKPRLPNDDYTVMDFDKPPTSSRKRPDTSEYVNFNPAVNRTVPVTTVASPLIKGFSAIGLSDNSGGFRPISIAEEPAYETLRQNAAECSSPAAKISRPNSVNSTRPSSTSSDLCSSSSTLVGSRPESVNSDRIRPSSVSSEGQLHYARLDLQPDESKISPGTEGGAAPAFLYAEIDFYKSGGAEAAATPGTATPTTKLRD